MIFRDIYVRSRTHIGSTTSKHRQARPYIYINILSVYSPFSDRVGLILDIICVVKTLEKKISGEY